MFGLFDDHVDHEVRDAMASKLNNTPRPNNFDPGNPNVDQEYLRMKETVSGIEVVNDTAERWVNDIQDYANVARD